MPSPSGLHSTPSQRAIDAGYCAFPLLDRDPTLAGLRDDPRFDRTRETARACRAAFETHVAAVGATAAR